MSTLSEEQLAAVLRRAVADPVDVPDRAAAVRRRAGRHRRRRVAGGTAVLAAALAVAAPALLTVGRNGGSSGHGNPQVAGTAPAGVARVIPAGLRRPLALPVLRPGEACPVSPSRRFPAGGGFSDPFTAVGAGPVYLAGGSSISFEYPPAKGSAFAGSAWSGQKALWVVDASYTGPVLLRGAQLDGNHKLRFEHSLDAIGHTGFYDTKPYPEVAYPGTTTAAGSGPIRTYPSAVGLQAPGCYAIQADGTSFSALIVFTAQLTRR